MNTIKWILLGTMAFGADLLTAFVLSLTWNWFVAPSFGIVDLSTKAIFGMTIGFSVLKMNRKTLSEDDSFDVILDLVVKKAISSACTLLAIWVAKGLL